MSLRKLPLLATGAFVLLWAIAFAGTHVPLHADVDELAFPHADKVVHSTIYAVLAIAAMVALRAWNFRRTTMLAFAVVGILFGLGIFDELTQTLAGRDCDPQDLMADTFGAALGVSLVGLLRGNAPPETVSPSDAKQ
ncbi:hypothetical protein GC197_14895 [bacterium]|nr:hypothetical protein [bacterium]